LIEQSGPFDLDRELDRRKMLLPGRVSPGPGLALDVLKLNLSRLFQAGDLLIRFCL
jgi:hypothetical protein